MFNSTLVQNIFCFVWLSLQIHPTVITIEQYYRFFFDTVVVVLLVLVVVLVVY